MDDDFRPDIDFDAPAAPAIAVPDDDLTAPPAPTNTVFYLTVSTPQTDAWDWYVPPVSICSPLCTH
jgi:hypothetical protein